MFGSALAPQLTFVKTYDFLFCLDSQNPDEQVQQLAFEFLEAQGLSKMIGHPYACSKRPLN